MERSADRYLHKKFKKQLSIDPGGVKNARTTPPPTAATITTTNSNHCDDEPATCNDANVPNSHSTNVEAPAAPKSSISSVGGSGSAPTPCHISYVVRCEPATPTTTWDGPEAARLDLATATEKAAAATAGGKYVCSYCNLACSKPSVLQKHIRAHTNERPYPCVSCGFSFKTRSNLYKHCRSRTHANRVMGNRANELDVTQGPDDCVPCTNTNAISDQEVRTKPYKPRFHTMNVENPETVSNLAPLAASIDDDQPLNLTNKNRKRCLSEVTEPGTHKSLIKELLLKNLYADTNMQCPHCRMYFQTVTELELHKLRSCKGFIKSGARYSRSSSVNVASILTKNKNAFDNIPHLQATTFPLKSPGPFLGKTRLVESDKNKSFSFDDNLASDFPASARIMYPVSPLTVHQIKPKRPHPVKLFGGEVKITHPSGQTKCFQIDQPARYDEERFDGAISENRVVKSSLQSGGTVLQGKLSYGETQETVRSTPDVIKVYENTTSLSPSIDLMSLEKTRFIFDKQQQQQTSRVDSEANSELLARTAADDVATSGPYKYTNIMDFSQKAVKMLAPNLKQLHLSFAPNKLSPLTVDIKPEPPPPIITTARSYPSPKALDVVDAAHAENMQFAQRQIKLQQKMASASEPTVNSNPCNPLNILVNGKVVRYVPGMPGPVVAEPTTEVAYVGKQQRSSPVEKPVENHRKLAPPISPPKSKVGDAPRKFSRPNTLALKPSPAHKQHHGLTPTMFNQILISPDTPRVAKKYVQQFHHGTYFTYLGLKSSTKSVYCTLNKTQPFYVPHFNKLSMYSEWRQDPQTDRLYVSGYDSRQRHGRYSTAGKVAPSVVVHSSYKFSVTEQLNGQDGELTKSNSSLVGYESNEEYTYIRGRGRGRYICDQCGIRCKKPSMLKKHIRTHTNDRPYTCSHCNFSFKTKGNLTKHMKSKAHSKNYEASSSSNSSTQQSGTQSSESDSEDSGMDSSDDSTRQQEHEAAYGLLSLSQKNAHNFGVSHLDHMATSPTLSNSSSSMEPTHFMNKDQVTQINNSSIARNKILDRHVSIINLNTSRFLADVPLSTEPDEVRNLSQFLGRTNRDRPLTYPYTSPLIDAYTNVDQLVSPSENKSPDARTKCSPGTPSPTEKQRQCADANHLDRLSRLLEEKRAAPVVVPRTSPAPTTPQTPIVKVNDRIVLNNVPYNSGANDAKKRKIQTDECAKGKVRNHTSDSEAIDLSMSATTEESRFVFWCNGTSPTKENENAEPRNHYQTVLTSFDGTCSPMDIDNSAMETLADVATKQVKLEKNTLAKSVASEFLKFATNHIGSETSGGDSGNFIGAGKDVMDFIGKPEENKSCSICAKTFSKPSQLRLHMNVHYLERPFRCDPCAVSFRTKGHLQKHERSASHHNKLSSSPLLSSSEPRPFKCSDCNIAFRIHGHLAKHLRSKMHIMKLECLAKIPFGLYAELERANSLLTEINTTDGDQCLESLKALALKVFMNDPSKLNQYEVETNNANTTDS